MGRTMGGLWKLNNSKQIREGGQSSKNNQHYGEFPGFISKRYLLTLTQEETDWFMELHSGYEKYFQEKPHFWKKEQ